MRRICVLLSLMFIVYVVSYAVFRQANIEVWEKDKKEYVIFPVSLPVLYYIFRPLTYVDAAATGMRFHIGPHRE